MKTITIILAAVLALQINVLIASNDGAAISSKINVNSTSLAPITPTEATFDDVTAPFEFSTLAPVAPAEASFEDASEDIAITSLAPTTPVEADFNDATTLGINICTLAPVTPAVADFE